MLNNSGINIFPLTPQNKFIQDGLSKSIFINGRDIYNYTTYQFLGTNVYLIKNRKYGYLGFAYGESTLFYETLEDVIEYLSAEAQEYIYFNLDLFNRGD